jgi:DNA-binding SARP family transcriptional activator
LPRDCNGLLAPSVWKDDVIERVAMLQYRALGALTVADDGDDVSVGGSRQRRLVAMLLVHRNSVVSADRLSEAVFAGEPTSAAPTTLRSYVARLRKVIDGNGAGSMVVTQAPGYMLEVRDDAFDVARFEGLIADGRSRLADDDAVAAASALREALALWRGDAYVEFADEEWVRPEAQRLGELRLVAYEQLVDAELACGRAAEMIPQLETLVAEHPLREALRGQLMIALYRTGRQVDALRVFQAYREVLAEELGLDPSPQLAELERRILAHDATLELAEPAGLPLRGYRLGERLGTGRDGAVYAARLSGVEHDFAIRIMGDEIADRPGFVRSFEADAQRVASLRHEAIVAIHDCWREPGGAYLVMRRMRGGTLRDQLDRGPLPSADVVALATRIGAALTAAAEQGIVHGRVTPESVLFDDAGAAHLADFTLGTDGVRQPSDDVRGYASLVSEALTGRPSAGALSNGVPAPVADVLARGLGPVGRPRIAEFVPALLAALVGKAVEPLVKLPNPYKGLRAFEESDSGDFFGRDGLVDETLARLAHDDQRGRLVLVVGGSGSGKSSVVRAGLLPALRRGQVQGSERWFVTAMLPGISPFKALAESLRRVAVAETDGLADELAFGEGEIDGGLHRLLPGGGQLLLVIDQFEELFTLADEAERRAFLDGLTQAISAADSRLRVVATLRADFYDRPLRFHRFGTLVQDATVTVPAMSAAELEAAIVGPAERVGARVEPTLVAELVAAVVDEPAALPSLQYTLYELAERSPDRNLTLAAYRELGGVDAAIAARAEQLYRSLDGAQRGAIRRVFERLVVVNADGEPTRRRTPRSELATPGTEKSIDGAIEAWAYARLLTLDRHPATREPTVEVAHEALLRDWPRLRGWIDEHRDAIAAMGQLRDAAATWAELDRDPGALYRGARLEITLEATDSRSDTLPAREREFLDASRDERDREQRREAERVKRQARANRRLRTQLAALAIALVAAIAVGFVAVDQRQRAERQGRVATARELAAAATANLDVDSQRSILLALAAVDHTRSADGSVLPEAEQALHDAVSAATAQPTLGDPSGPLDWSPDGRRIAATWREGTIDIRDAQSGRLLRSLPDHNARGTGVAFNHDGTLLGTTGQDGLAKIWDMETGKELYTLESPTGLEASAPSFSADGSLFAAAWRSENLVRILDLTTGQIVREIRSIPLPMSTSFNPSGTRIAIASQRDPTVVVDVRSGDEMLTLGKLGAQDAAWSPDGALIATYSAGGSVRIFDARTGRQNFLLPRHPVAPVVEDPDLSSDGFPPLRIGVPAQLSFSADGSRLATASTGGVRIWDPDTGEQQLVVRMPFSSVALSPDGSWIASASADGDVQVAPLDLDEVIEVAKGELTRSLTDEECQQYLHVEHCPQP